MSNPNNVSLNINHDLEFIDGNALNIPTLSILTEDGDIHPSATAPDISKHTALKLLLWVIAANKLCSICTVFN